MTKGAGIAPCLDQSTWTFSPISNDAAPILKSECEGSAKAQAAKTTLNLSKRLPSSPAFDPRSRRNARHHRHGPTTVKALDSHLRCKWPFPTASGVECDGRISVPTCVTGSGKDDENLDSALDGPPAARGSLCKRCSRSLLCPAEFSFFPSPA
jgi:hypothetical protein